MAGEKRTMVPKLQVEGPPDITFENGMFSIKSDAEIGGMSIDFESESDSKPVIQNLIEFEIRQGTTPTEEMRVLFLPCFDKPAKGLASGRCRICELTGDARVARLDVVDY